MSYIHLRVADRDKIGYWEGDTIIGSNRSGVILTFNELNSQFALIGELPVKTLMRQQEASRNYSLKFLLVRT